ncbi:MAG: trypsin-like serine protease [Pseudomonadota bacterium]
MKKFVISLLASLLIAGSPATAQNQKRTLDDRSDLYGWEAVGRLDVGTRSFCTGTLIARDLVLTAAHCALDKRTGQPYLPGEVTFRAGLANGAALAERKVVQIAAHPGYGANDPLSPQSVRDDVALMRLEDPIPYDIADPFGLYSGRVIGNELSIASYGRGRSEAITRERSCRILERRQGLITFDCDVTFGSSGSAILTKNGARWQILSVVSAVGVYDGKKVGFGMELGDTVSKLKAIMRRDAPQPKAAIRRLQVGSGKSGSGAKFISSGGG